MKKNLKIKNVPIKINPYIITGDKDENVEKEFLKTGRLYCCIEASHLTDHPLLNPNDIPWDSEDCERYCIPHQEKPLLFVEDNLKVTSIPLPGSHTFVRFPDNSFGYFVYNKDLIQKQIVEAICVCGVCHLRDKENKRRLYSNFSHVGIALNGKNLLLSKRAECWFVTVYKLIECPMEKIKDWMLMGIDGLNKDDKEKVMEELGPQMLDTEKEWLYNKK